MNIEQANNIPLEELRSVIGDTYFKEIEGGSTIDHICAYLKSVGEDNTQVDALRWLQNMVNKQPSTKATTHSLTPDVERWLEIRTEPLEDLALIRYLESRKISIPLARQFLGEVFIKHPKQNRRWWALGLMNEEGGIEVRNPFIKGYVSRQGITFVRATSSVRPKRIHLFEGFMDMLSAFTHFPKISEHADCICLNGTHLLREAFAYITGYDYRIINSWMDNDDAGRHATALIDKYYKSQFQLGHQPVNNLYREHKDVNAWHVAAFHVDATKS